MPVEIERKFLVLADRLPSLHAGTVFIQGYLSESPHVRFRIENDRRGVLCVKRWIDSGARLELEFPREDMPPDEVAALCALALWPPLRKIRHRLPQPDGLVWEVDVYQERNAGLTTADVELPAANHPLECPDWVSPVGEITHNARFSNIHLCRNPFESWPEADRRATLAGHCP